MEHNYKGQLIEYCKKLGLSLRFEEVSSTGPSHDPRFTIQVFVNNEMVGEGNDKTKRTAANIAAKNAFLFLQSREHTQDQENHEGAQVLEHNQPPPTSSTSPEQNSVNGAMSMFAQEPNYVGMLNEFCQKKGWKCCSFVDDRRGPDHIPEFFCRAVIEERTFAEATGKDKKEAKKNAAHLALMVLKKEELTCVQAQVLEPNQQPPPTSTSPEHNSVNGAMSTLVQEPNYIGMLNEYCQKKGWKCCSFVDDRRGPDHIPEFFCRAVIEDRTFPEATGKNKKEAKKNAAHLTLRILKNDDPTSDRLQRIKELEDSDVAQATSTPKSESTNTTCSSQHTSEDKPLQLESSDSQITFHSSFTGTPVTSSRPHRPIVLAPKFSEQVNCTATEDPTFLQDFDNITEYGFGGYGTVFKARKKLDKKYYVVKKVKRRSEKDEAEIKALASLEHPHIVRYYHSWEGEDIFSDDSSSGDGQTQKKKLGCLFIQMEWCKKGTLENWIDTMEKVDKVKSLNIFQQILDGVEYIHSKKLIHRDLKPTNILFADDMVVKIADFGLVTPISEKLENESILRTAKKGTERYMAPEQLEKKNYENEVDIFPLGLILVELFWKFNTYHAKQKEWENLRRAELPPSFVKQFPYEEAIIKLMLSEEPKKRPTAAKLKEYFTAKLTLNSNTL